MFYQFPMKKRLEQELEIAKLKKTVENVESQRVAENEISSSQIKEMEIEVIANFRANIYFIE